MKLHIQAHVHVLCQLLITCAAECELLSGVRRCQDWLPGRELSWARFWTKFTTTSSQKDKLVHVHVYTHMYMYMYTHTCHIATCTYAVHNILRAFVW